MNTSNHPDRLAFLESLATGLAKELRTLAVSEVRYRRLFEADPDGILILNARTGRLTDANQVVVELLESQLEDMRNKELWQIGLFSDRESNQVALDSVRRDGHFTDNELLLVSKSGQRHQVDFVSNAYREGEVNLIQCHIRNITARKKLTTLNHPSHMVI